MMNKGSCICIFGSSGLADENSCVEWRVCHPEEGGGTVDDRNPALPRIRNIP